MPNPRITEILAIGGYVSTIRRQGRDYTEWIGTENLIEELNHQLSGKVMDEEVSPSQRKSDKKFITP